MSLPLRSFWQRLLMQRFGGLLLLVSLMAIVALATRVALVVKGAGDVVFDISLVGAFLTGFVFDLGASLLFAIPLALALWVAPRWSFTNRVLRAGWHAFFFVALCLMVFGAVAEWLFWDEFQVRFNFIAVDYLVYTHEVIDNIQQSYPMPLIFAGIAAVAGFGYLQIRSQGWITIWLDSAAKDGPRWKGGLGWTLAIVLAGFVLNEQQVPKFANNYNRELAKNGLWSLFAAFRANQLEYTHFYPLLPGSEAGKRMRTLLAHDGSTFVSTDVHDLRRQVPAPRAGEPELRPNIIQITVESLSAEFLGCFGSKEGLTPNLDALASKALLFTNFYATGNRTDRGMEALTLAVPPTPGRSLVKRPENANLFTLGSVLRTRGYATAFVYGGFGYFDNMNAFFGGNGYKVVDRLRVGDGDITFANAWGACDEDLFRWAMREADAEFAAGRPFHQFVMTTSNHRPFTFPDGRIDLPSKTSGRQGGVKYTDYAIGRFLELAAQKPWFKNTIFVIVADHCASSAGKTEVPVHRYHIPLFIYAPGGQIAPGKVDALASQVDFAPTLLGLLNWSYESRFFGWNVLAPGASGHGRALMGNYQKLGLFHDNRMQVLKPVRQSAIYDYDPATTQMAERAADPAMLEEAIAYYQTASYAYSHGLQSELKPAAK
ncbi:LTA synthase family protein [Nibricoccus sp. IMCC34717]|uniref:LTA synthase family protein n=1 Tax=Nibricoccus sp. IMCC34717 TaxID=3034021 RepID=UPI0038513AAF